MSLMAMGGWRILPIAKVWKDNPSLYWGMGLTAEAVANQYNVSRDAQDEFSLNSHLKALNAIKSETFKEQIVPIEVEHVFLDATENKKFNRCWN